MKFLLLLTAALVLVSCSPSQLGTFADAAQLSARAARAAQTITSAK